MESLRRRLWDDVGLVALVVLGVASLVAVPLAGSSDSAVFITVTGFSQLVFAVLALIFAVRAAWLRNLAPRVRRAWRIMLPSYALWPLTISLYAVFPGQPFPSPPDVLRLLIPVATLAGILAFAQWPTVAAERAKLRLTPVWWGSARPWCCGTWCSARPWTPVRSPGVRWCRA